VTGFLLSFGLSASLKWNNKNVFALKTFKELKYSVIENLFPTKVLGKRIAFYFNKVIILHSEGLSPLLKRI